MPYTRTSQSQSRGTSKPSRPPKRKNVKHSAPKDKISKYFNKTAKGDESVDSDSSTTGPLKETNLDESDLVDFKTPKSINKVSKILHRKASNLGAKRKRRANTENSLTSFIETNLIRSDVNPEHLQMALALSESSYDAEREQSSHEQIQSFKAAFEKFGFGYSKSKILTENRKDLFEITKKSNKKSRFRFITPTLKIRTAEEREELISSKIRLIIEQNERTVEEIKGKFDLELFSETLRRCDGAGRIFRLNHSTVEKLTDRFYCKSLKLGECVSSCGALLKDWTKIQGRDLSPLREVKPCEEATWNRSISPDLFGSDEEYEGVSCSPLNIEKFEDKLDSSKSSRFHYRESFSSNCDFKKNFEEKDDFYDTDKLVEKNCLDESIESSKNKSVLLGEQLKEPDFNVEDMGDYFRGISVLKNEDQHELSTHLTRTETDFNTLNCISQEAVEVYDLTQSDDDHEQLSTIDKSNLKNKYTLSSDDENGDNFVGKNKFNSDPNLKESASNDDALVELLRVKYRSDEFLNEKSQGLSENDKLFSRQISRHSSFGLSGLNITECNNEDKERNIKNEGDSLDCGSEKMLYNDTKSKYVNPSLPGDTTELYDLNEWENDIFPFQTPPRETHSIHPPINSFKELSTFGVSIGDESHLNVTQYVNELLSQKPQSSIKFERSKSDMQLSQESSTISDEELNYSSIFSTPYHNYTEPEEKALVSPQNKLTLADSPNVVLDRIDVPAKEDTPKAANFIIKTKNVTPMPNYEQMDTPKVVKELNKFGLKPLKRAKGVKMLTYIYETTHPLVGDEHGKVVKKRRKTDESVPRERVHEDEELIFERAQSKRVYSCRVPLHIVWHNFVMSNPSIRESILLYEPLQLEVLHVMLKEQGFKFNIQDLLRFLDRKCITIRTAQNQRHKKS